MYKDRDEQLAHEVGDGVPETCGNLRTEQDYENETALVQEGGRGRVSRTQGRRWREAARCCKPRCRGRRRGQSRRTTLRDMH